MGKCEGKGLDLYVSCTSAASASSCRLRVPAGIMEKAGGEARSARERKSSSKSKQPKFARNSNTGGDVASEVLADYRTATNTVYHNSTYPSQILLPIIESD